MFGDLVLMGLRVCNLGIMENFEVCDLRIREKLGIMENFAVSDLGIMENFGVCDLGIMEISLLCVVLSGVSWAIDMLKFLICQLALNVWQVS